MGRSDYSRAKELFLRACELPAHERAALLDGKCGDDGLRREVESLLFRHDLDRDLTMACLQQGRRPVAGESVTHYSLLRRLGSGGMGEVFEAEDLRLGRKVALKFLHPWVACNEDLRSRFEREARAASALDHPNICNIHEIDETRDGRLFIAMSLYEGENLEQRIARGPLEVGGALSAVCQVAEGLARAHDQGIVHRDIKPANLLLTLDGTVKILDFGLAKLAGGADLSKTGVAMGTVSYMSPEQAMGEAVDHRSDIWSLGVVLYEAITGRLPFRGEHPQSVIYSILNQEPQRPEVLGPGLGDRLYDVIRGALAKPPEERYQRMSEMQRELLSIGADGPAEAAAAQRPASLRTAAPQSEDSSAFVSREGELAELAGHLRSAVAGTGIVAFVTGEAGTGKTELMSEFARRAQRERSDLLVAGGNCNAHTGVGDPYLPFREVLSLLTGDVGAGWAAKAVSTDRRRRLGSALTTAARALVESGQGLIDTFVAGAALAERAAARTAGEPDWLGRLAELVQKRRGPPEAAPPAQSDLFEQYAKVVLAVAFEKPLVVLLDDLQWADAGSIGLLFHLGRRIRRSRILIVGAYRGSEIALGRDGGRHPLEPVVSELKRHFGKLEIGLDRAEGRRFVDAVLDRRPNRLARGFRETLYAQTRGHALHTVELLREMEASQALVRDAEGRLVEGPNLDWSAVPTRVEAVVAERIDRLPDGLRELLVLASVEGEDFTAEAVAKAAGLTDLETVRRLGGELDKRHRLVRPEGVRQLAASRLSLYRFRHHLFQKYLYANLTEPERAYLHEAIGLALEELYGEQAAEISVQLARHFEQAGVATRAMRYRQQAGLKAARQSADLEAISHFRKALEHLATLPDDAQRARQELELLMALGPVLMAVKGWSAPETVETYSRARQLCERMGEGAPLYSVLWGLYQSNLLQARLETARGMAQELLSLAESLQDPDLLPVAYRSLGEVSFWRAELGAGRDFSEQGFSLYDPARHRALGFAYGTDPGIFCLGFSAWSLGYLGYPEKTLERIRRTEALAHDIEHEFSVGFAQYFVAIGHHVRGDAAAARRSTESVMALAREQGFEVLVHLAGVLHGWALAQLGETEQGIAAMRQGLESYAEPLARPWFLSMLAEALVGTGDLEAAEEAVAEALATSQRTASRVWDPDLHRLRGEALAGRGAPASEVEECLRQALDVARDLGARLAELRAATSLARLLQEQKRDGEGRRLLAAVYDGFTEGFDTRSLKQAAALLAG